tara:strand:- start:405 stop:1151 length:747 start_codon:yes stop_codon:yes gene_type:complete
MVNSDLSKLLKETFKLSLYEAKSYQSVIEGAKQPKYISNRAGVPLPRIYDTLKSLEEKGFIRRDNDSYFPVEPNIALEGRIVQFKHEFESKLKKQWEVKEIITKSLKTESKQFEEEKFEILIGIHNIGNKFLEIVKKSTKIIITVKKAFQVKDLFLSYLKSFDYEEKELIIIIPKYYKISKKDNQLFKELGIKVKKENAILLDLMVSNEGDVLIGVPDSSGSTTHAIAVWIKSKTFTESLISSLIEKN